jgi:hypothetical protein
LKKRYMNKQWRSKKALAKIPKGYGIITGCGDIRDIAKFGVRHFFDLGEVVKIVSTKEINVWCYSEEKGLDQYVSPRHILINN